MTRTPSRSMAAFSAAPTRVIPPAIRPDCASVDQSLCGWSLIDRILPLDEWQPDDKAETEAMLEKAARPYESPLAEL
jgi:hypothetical protein